MKDIRIALVIFESTSQKESNLDNMALRVKSAKKEKVDIICFPELNMTGYSVVSRIKYVAELIPNTLSEKLLQMAKDEDIVILAGMAEKAQNGKIFASHLVADPDKSKVSIYRKLHIAPPENHVLSQGDKVKIFEARGIKFGIQLCYDVHFPELSSCMAMMGAELIFIPHASPRGTVVDKFNSWMRHLPARAFDNSLFIAACNQTGIYKKGMNFPGIALVIDPSGKVVAKDISNNEGMLICDLKSENLYDVRKNRMRFFLPNRRPELYCYK
mmetsp:Transcript_19054/g.8859  ORF Transcript_19054/g.8859 Transcript_19054/m.8859 type:complete len:271 (-) Transcript_19054:797-1609(-)